MPTDTQSHAPIRLRRAYKKVWPYLRHVLTLGFILLVLALLVHHAKEVEWRAVVDTLKDYSWLTTLAGIGCALVTCLIYSSYDLFGRFYINSKVAKIRMIVSAVISCAFRLNLRGVIRRMGVVVRRY